MTRLLNKSDMEKLTTRRLLAYRDSLLQWHETPQHDCDYDDSRCKQGKIWQETYANVKDVLASREHINRPTTGK